MANPVCGLCGGYDYYKTARFNYPLQVTSMQFSVELQQMKSNGTQSSE